VTAAAALWALVGIIIDRFTTSHTTLASVETFFAANFAFLMFRIVCYQYNRLSYFKRLRLHRRFTRDEIESIYECERPHPLAILVPSYCEELHVLRMTLMSAALTEYPDRRVVLLIDNPPHPSDPAAHKELVATRELVRELDAMFRVQHRLFAAECAAFEDRRSSGALDLVGESRHLANLYRQVAVWLEERAAMHQLQDHYDDLYVGRILLEPAAAHRARAEKVAAHGRPTGVRLSESQIAREYRRLMALFAAPIASFERKRYVNLSHTSNKAMNLNSYIGLWGRNLREVIRPGGLHLEDCGEEIAQLKVREADYIITLDADSMLLGDYALRLTHIMDQPEAARYAVVQSPFTAVPGSASLLEHVAGAQTDVQWFSTQGSTLQHASFWVGANALLRRAALEDISETITERGFAVKRYIHDRTLVEDTESTIDLVARGWQVYCHPERLSYTATPSDFGALLIQRQRWSNGPVLILPKLISYLLTGGRRLARLPEAALRLHNLTAVLASASVLLIISVPFPDGRRFPAFFLMACVVPYYWIYARDLISAGYEWWDLPRVHALDLLLIPVNLTGLVKSLRQGITGRQSPFLRTPKVPGRTAAPGLHVLMPILIFMSITRWTYQVMQQGGFGYCVYGILNAVYLIYGIICYVQLRPGLADIALSATRIGRWIDRLLFREGAPRPAKLASEPARSEKLESVVSEAAQ
jgi:cellulose synthase/poly-beta-1,6-N-acetylglucosamine synthase-like glycosyltransferase